MILYIFFKISALNYKELRATPLASRFYLKVEMNSISNLKRGCLINKINSPRVEYLESVSDTDPKKNV